MPLQLPAADSLAVDSSRNMIYVTDDITEAIYVWNNATTVTGNIVPDRTITISGVTGGLEGVAIDPGRDRLYVSGFGYVYILNNASTQTGAVAADATLSVSSLESLFLDQQNDRLYVVLTSSAVVVYDSASTLTSASTPNRTITSSQSLPFHGIWVDPSTDRLYLGSRTASSGGNNLFIFGNASTLNGSYDPDTASTARMVFSLLMNVMVDNQDHLYMWPDSATYVAIYNNVSTLAGNVTAPPDKTIYGVVNKGYGMGYLSY